ncbi:MAG: hypothetical protein U0984_11870 [Prosthecobacter sp.]|nr:hypothetical protein [Prosthecobacter sp.]
MNDETIIDASANAPAARLPWLALGIVAIAALASAMVVAWDWQAWTVVWAEMGGVENMRSMGSSLGRLMAALVVATATALAFAISLRRLPAWLRTTLAVLAKSIALFPVAALTWSFIGLWVGKWGWPIESLMPVEAGKGFLPRMAATLWNWSLPVLLLAVPLTADLTAWLLTTIARAPSPGLVDALAAKGLDGKRIFYRHHLPRICAGLAGKLPFVTLLGAGYLIAVEDVLDLPGAAFSLARALRAGAADPLAAGVVLWSMTAALGCTITWLLCRVFCPRGQSTAPRPSASSRLLESAMVIGLSRAAGWRRHLLPRQFRSALHLLFCGASWAVVGTILISTIVGWGPGVVLAEATKSALTDPWASLSAGVSPALCALFLWLLSRIMAPRSIP